MNLLNVEDRDEDWKQAFVMYAHMTGYLSSYAANNEPPDRTSDGSAYVALPQGAFFNSDPRRLQYFQPTRIATALWMVSQYAWACGNEPLANEWLTITLDEMGHGDLSTLDAMTYRDLVPRLLISEKFDEAINGGVCYAKAAVIGNLAAQRGGEFMENMDGPLDAMALELGDDALTLASRFGIIAALIPACLRILQVRLTDVEHSRQLAAEVSELCKAVALAGSTSERWLSAADLFGMLSDEQCSGSQVIKRANELDRRGESELKNLGYLIAGSVVPLNEAVKSHIVTLQAISTWFSEDDRTYLTIVLPYVESFWKSAVTNQRFAIRNPDAVDAALNEALISPQKGRTRRILKAALIGLPVQGLPDGVRWVASV